jgi:Flp pilus assembly pilin Flp
MTTTEVWQAVGALAAVAGVVTVVGVAVVSGFFGWLSKKLDAIGAHLAKQDAHLAKQDSAIARIRNDVAWLKREIKGAPSADEDEEDE